jgi:uncharacterized membrane protein
VRKSSAWPGFSLAADAESGKIEGAIRFVRGIPVEAVFGDSFRGASKMTPVLNNSEASSDPRTHNFYRFHRPHLHLGAVFGDDWFAMKAETFARFFGTPFFLIVQTVFVSIWIALNIAGLTDFDVYPFILLNLAFSLQAAYAAPLILLAQTRQADRDKVHAIADAQHREDLHHASEERVALAAQQQAQLLEMMQQNTQLTETVKLLTERVEQLTAEIHRAIVAKSA